MFDAIRYQLYLLQLESYELPRYFRLLRKKGIFPPKKLRGNLKWTGKVKLLLIISVLIHLLLSVIAALAAGFVYFDFWVGLFTFLFLLVGLGFFYFIFFAIGLELIYPLQLYLKNKVVHEAKERLSKLENLKIIGIAGSYGKTSMKEALKVVLSEKFKVAAPPESINTPIGIAKYINNEVDEKIGVLIIEMGEHYQGDVAELCAMVRPDIGVITGINESHLERLTDLSITVKTVFEMADGIKETGLLILNADNNNVVENFKKYTKGKKISFYSSGDNSMSQYRVSELSFSADDLINKFLISDTSQIVGRFQSKILAEYVSGLAVACIVVGKQLEMENDKIAFGFSKIKPVPHRLEPIINPNGLIVIDDSYNGNPDGVREAIRLLSKFTGRRKVFLTPGLVEMGKSAEAVHKKIGKELSGVADLVMLIDNSVTPFIEKGLKENGFADDKIIWYSSAQEAHQSLDKVLKPGDVILFQNDWGDQYI
ncbi:MAG: UDP-N-acetylmuramoyl-tripeptide--D-alanyl-D-alanine ligase [Candidatus Buchananbacteria bacterium]